MLRLGTCNSKLSVRLEVTINMVESSYANNGRHSGRALSRTEDESCPGEALGEGIGPPKRGSRTSPTEVEKGAANHPTTGSVEVAGKA